MFIQKYNVEIIVVFIYSAFVKNIKTTKIGKKMIAMFFILVIIDLTPS